MKKYCTCNEGYITIASFQMQGIGFDILDVWVNWHNTNEHFSVEEFIRANCQYPGEWDGEVERVIATETHIVTATHVRSKDGSTSCHATSFIRVVDGKIASMEEYWGDDGPAPEWRRNMHIGTKINAGD